jgi:hypothetical protein
MSSSSWREWWSAVAVIRLRTADADVCHARSHRGHKLPASLLAYGLAWRALLGEAVRIADPDHAIRRAALDHVRRLARHYDDLVPRTALLEGFSFGGERWSLGSLQNGIYRPRRFAGPAALTLLTATHAPGQPAPPRGVRTCQRLGDRAPARSPGRSFTASVASALLQSAIWQAGRSWRPRF